MSSVLSVAWSVFAFILALAPLIFLHELGHYWVGRWCGVKADVFSIGFGKALTSWRDKRGTEWRIAWMPLGGYVRFAGDMNAVGEPDAAWLALPAAERNQTFPSKPVWKRALIVLAGPVANLLVAVVIFAGLFAAIGQPQLPPVIGLVAPNSAAAVAGLQTGDRITVIDGNTITTFDDIPLYVQIHPGERIDIAFVRAGQALTIPVTPRLDVLRDRFGKETRRGMLGIGLPRIAMIQLRWWQLPGAAVREVGNVLSMQVKGLGQIIRGQRSLGELSGPVGTAQVSGEVASAGLMPFLYFIAFVSINLGFINLLPIPILDGGHLLSYLIEAVWRRPLGAQALEWAFRAGFALVVTLMLFVTFNDLGGFAWFNRLAGLIG